MSEANVEIVRQVFEEFFAAMERSDPGGWFDSAPVGDDYEWIVEFDRGLDGRSVWRGREGFVEFMQIWTDEFEDWSMELERLVDAGDDRVVALTHQSATGKGSGVPVELSIGQVLELEGGRLIRARSYRSHAEALEAAGLSE
jgi:ketosteroid isomerase-like protein